MMDECSKDLKSKTLALPSFPHVANKWDEFVKNLTSKTSLSWAINCVLTLILFKSHTVQVVSIDDEMMIDGSFLFQSHEVTGGKLPNTLVSPPTGKTPDNPCLL